ncbi:M20/M25/M40 family metallo-hydrolase [Phreatobacter stygius]|uniref:M20/M25/M40 family metallo-hydrolase n=1 Tax=Phreatobacter stygius TaxID=1940610 RepID=A0A4D7B4V1_9HYPH|nr:M20/M25/M40 family metallo-hydrolase [Phreatobacter stygius]QCI66043.1 M20/M25/M40 family metallo-hydrolase [Phreatobacter stygius]
MTTAQSARLHDLVHQRFEDEVAFLAALVKMPSDNPSGDCAAHAEHAAAWLERLGFTVERHRVPDDLVARHGMISVTNLVVRHRFGDGPVIALNAHGDVVPPGEGWTQDPYGAAVVDGWMYGRGVAVSKSDFATYAFALDALKRSGLPLNGTVELHLTYDEEAGGEIGPGWLLSQGLVRPDMAIAAGFSYAVVDAHNGCLHLEVVVEGKSAHAALPATGIDALEAATPILAALYAERRALQAATSSVPGIGSPQVTVGLIQGGINTNVVPDRITFRLDRRMIPEENPAVVESALRDLIAAAAAAYPAARVSIRRILLAEPLKATAEARRISELVGGHATAVFGEPVRSTGVPLYTDARLYAAKGVPVVLYGAGPKSIEEANAHRADERLRLSDLEKATEVIARSLVDLLS